MEESLADDILNLLVINGRLLLERVDGSASLDGVEESLRHDCGCFVGLSEGSSLVWLKELIRFGRELKLLGKASRVVVK